VLNLHTIKPIDKEAILKAVEETRRIVTFEDHNIIGGMGTAVADVIAESGKGCAFQKVGIPDEFTVIGYPEDVHNHYKIDTDGIIEKVREVMGKDFEEDESWEDEI
jgi:transketolase